MAAAGSYIEATYSRYRLYAININTGRIRFPPSERIDVYKRQVQPPAIAYRTGSRTPRRGNGKTPYLDVYKRQILPCPTLTSGEQRTKTKQSANSSFRRVSTSPACMPCLLYTSPPSRRRRMKNTIDYQIIIEYYRLSNYC